MGEMRVMDKDKGDLRVIWDKTIKVEVEAAKKQFEELLKKGYKAFLVKMSEDKPDKGKEVKEFDPDFGMLILAPAPKPGCIGRIACPPAP